MPGLGLGLGLDFLDAGTRVRDNAFRITVDTTQAGSASDTFVLPLHNGTSYDFEVDWGDGVIESVSGSSLSSKSHTYALSGTYQIAITGTFPRIFFNNGGDKLKLSSIDNWGDIVWSSMFAAFWGCSNMVGTYTDAPNTSSVTNMALMFYNCQSFNSPVNFDTSSVTSMSFMFRDCSSFNQSVSNFDTSSVTTMNSMFFGCSSFKQSLATFDMTSVANVTNMLLGCDINESGTTTNYDNTLIAWEAQDLVDSLSFHGGNSKYGFNAALARQAIIDDDSWTITDGGYSDVSADYSDAFQITVDTTQSGSASDTMEIPLVSGETYSYFVDWGDGSGEMVQGSALTTSSKTYSSGGTYQISITGTFPYIYFNNGGDKLKLSSIDNWGDIVWSSMERAFYGCSNMVGTYTDAPNTSSVTNMSSMFRSCSSFNSPVNFDTSLVTTMYRMFRDCSSFNSPVNFDTSSVTTMQDMFAFCSSFNQSVSSFDTSSVTSMLQMFRGCSSFNQSVSSLNTSSVATMNLMFFGCSSFKQSLATFDMTSVANVTDMLSGCDINEAGTTTNYDNTLIAWELQDLVDGLSFNGGTSKYSSTGETARDAIINDDSWVITDGGIAEGILDLYTGAAAAYSLRQLATGSQTVVRVRRSSDNAEDDFTATEVVDGTMLAWVGTTASDDGFVTVWYDQAGSNDATQATAAEQPKIVDAGVLVEENGRPAVDFDGVDDYLSNASSLSYSGGASWYSVYNLIGGTSKRLWCDDITGVQGYAVFYYDDIYQVNDNGSGYDTIIPLGFLSKQQLASFNFDDSNGNYNYAFDGSNISGTISGWIGPIGTSGASNIGIMASGNGQQFGEGRLQELIIYPNDQSSNRTGIETNINNHYAIYAGSPVSGLLYDYPSSAAAYSLRQLTIYDNGYKETLVRVRRDSDNAEVDVKADTNYEISLSSLTSDNVSLGTWIGSDSGFVTSWYDQSGNDNDATQATAASQPKIVDAGVLVEENGRPAVDFDGVDDLLNTTSLSASQPITLISVNSAGSSVVSQGIIDLGGDALLFYRIDGGFAINAGITLTSAGIIDYTLNTQYLQFGLFDTTSSSLYINSNLGVSGNVGANTILGNLTLGSVVQFSLLLNGKIQEAIYYPSDESSNRVGIETNINNHYNIYP